MPQVTLYFDDETERLMRERAKATGLSYSKWVALLIQSKARSEWPPSIAALAGRFSDFPLAEAARASLGEDATRELF